MSEAVARLPPMDDEVIDGIVVDDEPAGPDASARPAEDAGAVAPARPAPVTERRPAGELVRTQAAAVAATGFAVGAVTAVALNRRRTRKAAKKSVNGKVRKELAKDVVASRSFLVDVHLLRPKD